jgi:hypothetical protein
MLVFFVLASAVLVHNLLAYSGYRDYAEIILDGQVVKRVSLVEDYVFSLPERPGVVFEVRDGLIAFGASDCPNQICVNAGFIGRPGQMAVCMPHRLVLVVAGYD